MNINPLALPSLPLAQRAALPDAPAIYFALAEDGAVLYIGKARRLVARWKSTMHHRYTELAALPSVRLAWLVVSDESLLSGIEQACIEYFNPPLNSTLRPRLDAPPVLRVREQAIAHGFRQADLFQAINAQRQQDGRAWVSMQTIARYWSSAVLDSFSWSFLQEIAAVYGCSVYELLPEDDGLGNKLPTLRRAVKQVA